MQNKELHRISVTGIIFRLNDAGKYEYLITKRSPHKKVFPNLWTVPGGGLEAGDYINEKPTTKQGHWYFAVTKALRREIKEEVNLEIDNIEYLLDITFVANDEFHLVLSYFCKYKSGEVKLDEDSTDFKWVTLEEAGNYELIDGILDEIKMVEEKLKARQ